MEIVFPVPNFPHNTTRIVGVDCRTARRQLNNSNDERRHINEHSSNVSIYNLFIQNLNPSIPVLYILMVELMENQAFQQYLIQLYTSCQHHRV